MSSLKNQQQRTLKAAQLETPLGMMLAIADDELLYFLDFINPSAIVILNQKLAVRGFGNHLGKWEGEDERWGASPFHHEVCHLPKLERKIKKIHLATKSLIIPGMTEPLYSIAQELTLYFAGKLDAFKTPYALLGSSFQKEVWNALLKIPYATTQSYAEEAAAISNPTAVRAVANANGANQLAIVIPCHRVISSDGGLGGYGSGLSRKEWLLRHEKEMQQRF